MTTNTVLISGASIAGPALAHWLARAGFTPTVVERAPAPRPGGQAIDVRGAAVEVVEWMGVLPQIRAAHQGMRGMSFVDDAGAELMSTTAMSFTGGPTDGPDVEILRDDLSAILVGAADGVEFRYGDTITALDEQPDGVRVTFEHAPPRTFGLVIGADGLHSPTRRLVFGPERDFSTHLNTYLAVFSAPNVLGLDHWQVMHQAANGLAGVYPARDGTEARVMLGFSSPELDVDHRDTRRQRELVAEAFAGAGWEVPRLLELMWAAPDFYFDAMSQIHLDRWSSGRVGLVGDAAWCASPISGQGTSLAIVGAYVLAGELAAAGGDHHAAFARYEDVLRGFVGMNQELALTNGERMREVADGQMGGTEHMQEHWVASAANAVELRDYPFCTARQDGPLSRDRHLSAAPAR